jgi:hypothetical protein
MQFKAEMVIEQSDGHTLCPIIDGLSSDALSIIESYKTSGRSWAREDMKITKVHELLALTYNPVKAKSVLVVSFENGEQDFFVSVNEIKSNYDWVIINDEISKQPYQEIVAPEHLAEMAAKYADLDA